MIHTMTTIIPDGYTRETQIQKAAIVVYRGMLPLAPDLQLLLFQRILGFVARVGTG